MAGKQDGRGRALRTAAASVSAILAGPATNRRHVAVAATANADELVNEHAAAHRNYKPHRLVDLTGELGEGPGKYHRVVRRVPRYETYYNRSEQTPADYEIYRAARWLDEINEMAQAGLTKSVLDIGHGGSPYAHLAINERAARARIDMEWVDDLFSRMAQPRKDLPPADLRLELRILHAIVINDMTFTEFGLAERPYPAGEIDVADPAAVKKREVEEKAHRLKVKRWASKLYQVAINRLLLGLRDRAPHWFAPPRKPRVRLAGTFDYSGIESDLQPSALAS